MKIILVGIDRDGTLIHDPGYFGTNETWKEELRFLKGVSEGIRLLNQNPRITTFVATNQAGVALGRYTTDRVKEIHAYIDEILRKKGAQIHNWQFTPYIDSDYAIERGIPPDNDWLVRDDDPRRELRKPRIGMVRQAMREMSITSGDISHIYFIGDKNDDFLTAINAGATPVIVRNGVNDEEIKKIEGYKQVPYIAQDFKDAAQWIMEDIKKNDY